MTGLRSRSALPYAALPYAALLSALSVPLWTDDAFVLQLLFRVAIFAVVGIAWNLIGGYGGQLSLGHSAYFGLGSYGFSLLGLALRVPLGAALLLGAAVACLFALVIGSITFRLRGPYFVLSTIATAEIVRIVALNARFTHGAIGLLSPSLFQNPGVDAKFYVASLVLLAAALGLAEWIDGSRFGYRLLAIRENEDTAMAVGVDPARSKLLALLPSALFTALAGGIYASYSGFVGPESVLTIDISVQAAVVALLGGVATVWGPLVGSAILTLCAELFKAYFKEAHLLIYGSLLVAVVLFLPDGVVGLGKRLGERGLARLRGARARPQRSDDGPR
jgi:branched-chain amino acid transport system permease protein